MDRLSQRILLALADSGHGLKTGEIMRETVDDRGRVYYRLDQKLRPAGLVGEVRREPHNSQQETIRWGLTDRGAEWVEQHRDDLEGAQTVSELSEEVERLRGEVRAAQSQASQAAAEVDDIADEHADTMEALGEIWQQYQDHTEDVERQVDRQVDDRVSDIRSDLRSLDKRLSRLEGRVEGVEEEVDEEVEAIRGDLAEMVEKFRELEGAHNDRLADLDDRLGEVEERPRLADRGLLGRLRLFIAGT